MIDVARDSETHGYLARLRRFARMRSSRRMPGSSMIGDALATRALNGRLDFVVRMLVDSGIQFDGRVTVEPLTGGRSNITLRLKDESGASVVLRRPPLGHILPSAHDVLRESRIVAALASAAVPVPRILLACDDHDVIGSPFYVANWVPGLVLRSADDAAIIPLSDRAGATADLVATLAAVHAVNLDEVGLTGLARRTGFLGRQLDRWIQQWRLTTTRVVDDVTDGTPHAGRIDAPC